MYLRRTQRRNRDGTVVFYYQLADNVWDKDKGCAVARILYNFGRAEQFEPDQLRRLAHSILRFFPSEEALAAEPDVRIRDAWPYGAVYVLEHLWRELGIDRVILEAIPTRSTRQRIERALFALVANRALAPYSKLYCYQQWLREEVFLPSARDLELHQLYLAMDVLDEHQEALERAIYFQMADLMNADVDLIFYDTTSLHFEIDQEDWSDDEDQEPALRRRGYSKNGRSDAPQIVVGLAVTRQGLPVRSWVFPGNTADVKTVETVKADLKGWRLGRCVVVGDAGMNSKDNRQKLELGGGKYILGARMRAGDEVSKQVLTRAGRYHQVADNLRVKEVWVGEGEERRRYVVCHNPEEARRQQKHREHVLKALQEELKTLRQPASDGSQSKRLCELRTSKRYGRYLEQDGDGNLRISAARVREAARYDGKWVITSNDDTLSAEDLALGYKQLLRVEQCFRTMKSGLRLRPVYHWTPRRIRAHVKLCVLALLLERVAEIRCGDTWRNLAAQLETVKVVEYERGSARVRQTTEVRGEVRTLLGKLRIPLPPKLHTIEPAPSA